MSEAEVIKTEIGLADQVTMDQTLRTIIAQMFENDNDTAILEVVLNGTDSTEAPRIELELRLKSINGQSTRSE